MQGEEIVAATKSFGINNNAADAWELEELLKKDEHENEHEEPEDTSWRKVRGKRKYCQQLS